MKTILRSFCLATLAIFTFSNCTLIGQNSIKPSKHRSTRDYQVKAFNNLDASTVGDIVYTQSTDGNVSLQISGPDNILDLIEVKVKGSTLHLSMKKSKIKNVKNLKIKLSSPELNTIDFKGVGNISIPQGLTTSTFNVYSKGVGEVKINQLKCEEVNIYCAGVGNINMSGEVTEAVYDSKGVGNINAENVKAKSVKATCAGVGNITCNASETLVATTKGIGNISYKGNAETQISKNGIGTVRHI